MSNKITGDISFGEVDHNLQSADLQLFLDSSNNINLRGRKEQNPYRIDIDLLCFKIENETGNIRLSDNLNNYTLEKRTNNYILKFNYIGDRITISNTEDLSNVILANLIEAEPEAEPEAEDETSNGITYSITVTNSGTSAYNLSGSDRTGTINGSNATVTLNRNDTITFVVNAVGHPFNIRNSLNGSAVSNPSASGHGRLIWTVIWTPITAGTYYYQCSIHSGMNGTIIVN